MQETRRRSLATELDPMCTTKSSPVATKILHAANKAQHSHIDKSLKNIVKKWMTVALYYKYKKIFFHAVL